MSALKKCIERETRIKEPLYQSTPALFRRLADNPAQLITDDLVSFLNFVVKENFGVSTQFFGKQRLEPDGAEVASLSYQEAVKKLSAKKAEQAGTIESHFFACLRLGQKLNYFGELHMLDNEVAWFTFFKSVTEFRPGVNLHKHMRQRHDVVSAKKSPVSWFKDKMPIRVQRIVQAAPKILLPSLMVVSGQEIVTEETEIGRQEVKTTPPRQSWRPDPALVIEDVVLTGWIDGEE